MLRRITSPMPRQALLVTRRALGTNIESSTREQFNSQYFQVLLKDLKARDDYVPPSSLNLYNKSFNEINDQMNKNIPQNMQKSEPWSSPYDNVTRSNFAQDVGHLESLFDALIHNRNYARAANILMVLHPLLDNPQTLIYSINTYLEMLCREDSTTAEQIDAFILQIPRKFKGVTPNDRTYAIQLSKHKDDYPSVLESIRSQSFKKIYRIFSHIDILGDELIQEMITSGAVKPNEIPKELKNLYQEFIEKKENENKPSAELQNSEIVNDNEIPTSDLITSPTASNSNIEGPEELVPVQSYNLKLIKYTLSGLTTESKDTLKRLAENLHSDLNINVTGEKDYFQLYRTLEDPEQKQQFNEILDLFNEEREKIIESKGFDAAKERWKHSYEEMKERGTFSQSKSLNVQLFRWYTDLLPYVEEEVKVCQKLLEVGNVDKMSKDATAAEKDLLKDRLFYAPYITLVPPQKMCVIAILELLKLNSTGGIIDGMRTARAVVSIGKALELEYRSQKLLSAEGDQKFRLKKKNIQELKKYVQRKRNLKFDKQSAETAEWTGQVHAKCGELLVRLLMHVAKVPVHGTDPVSGDSVTGLQPAFYHTFQFMNGQKLGILKIHKSLLKLLAGDVQSSIVQPQYLPMLVPPRPWTSYSSGGFMYSQNYLVRVRDSPETNAYLKAASEKGLLQPIYNGLNVLGKTAWTINRQVFEVITTVWNSGEAFLDIPPITGDVDLPPPPPKNADPGAKRDYQNLVRKMMNEHASFRSMRCDTNYKLEIARGFLGEKMFFPHNVDFRGRAYPLSPHLNHLGNDLTRSLFLFWEGRRLGKRGLEWLKIHFANLYGLDKKPLDERLKFTEENLPHILNCVKDPLKKDSYWMKAEKPWQALSVCFELSQAYELQNPEDYISHIPVHQDGTCNGLQHYAALGGDLEGALSVNLVPQDAPQDVYKFVASIVQNRVNKEAEEGNEDAIFIRDKITRKVVKQTVMTNVYGVTFIGAVAQIEKQIEHHFDNEGLAANLPGKMARYLANHVFASMRELFEGAHKIQDWLGVCAKRISKSVRTDVDDFGTSKTGKNNKPAHLSSVIWTTPLGLPCVQPYRSSKRQIITTNLQDIAISDPFGAAPVDARKQQAAFPPNFVHSLDATHMLLTAEACGKDGIAFASVHDSFWTHAADVDIMNKNCREQFIKLHEDNLISKLKSEFERRYKGALQVIHISGTHPIAKEIRQIRKDIVKQLGRPLTVADELYLEKRRQELLNSADPNQVELGKKMVTTVSVTEGKGLEQEDVASGSTKSMQILIPLVFPDIPEKGDFDIKQIKDSKYFFS